MVTPIEYKVKVYPNGDKFWFLNGRLQREDGPAIEHRDGSKSWYLNGERHRADGPAIEYSKGSKEWYLNGELHREDGPAIERSNGSKFWYLNNKKLAEAEFNARMNPVAKELTIAEMEKILGYRIKVVK